MNINIGFLQKQAKDFEGYPSWYVVHVSSVDGDWEGLYVNGNLICEAHSINFPRLLDVLINNFQGDIISFEEECAGDWLQEAGSFPETLCELHFQHSLCFS